MSTSAQSSNALVLAPDQIASNKLALSLGLEREAMLTTIKAQCFRNMHPDQVSNAMLATFVQVAQTLEVNPLLPGMLYAYPERNGGITPIIGPDGVFKLLSSRPDILGWTAKHETIDGEKACTAIIKHKHLGEISKTVFLSEWRVANSPNWVTRPRHMLEIRALKQCARQIIHGIPIDEDERTFIDISETPLPATNVTPGAGEPGAGGDGGAPSSESGSTPAPKRAAVPGRKQRGASALSTAPTPADPKNVTPSAGDTPPAPAPEPTLGKASPDGGPVVDVEVTPAPTAPAAEPASTPAPTPEATPAPESPAAEPAPAGYKPRFDQPEGWPKTIEANVAFVFATKGNYKKRDGTDVTSGDLSLVTLAGPAIEKEHALGKGPTGSPVCKVIFDPENAELLAVAKPSVAVMMLTVEMWPSQSKPGQFAPVVTRFEDVPSI